MAVADGESEIANFKIILQPSGISGIFFPEGNLKGEPNQEPLQTNTTLT